MPHRSRCFDERAPGELVTIDRRVSADRAGHGLRSAVTAFAGWLLGVPLGYLLAQTMGWAVGEAVGLSIAFVFPLGYIAIALIGTVTFALLVMLAPLRRAVRFKPGEALRYS